MKQSIKLLSIAALAMSCVCISCDVENGKDGVNGTNGANGVDGTNGVNGIDGKDGADGKNGLDATTLFSTRPVAEISLGDGVPEISAYDPETELIFSTNSDADEVDVINISDLRNPSLETPIDITLYGGGVNSVAVKNELLAIAVEADPATDPGKIVVFKTSDLTTPVAQVTAGALPDMVTFSPDGKWIIAANEGEPNDDYDIDPDGTITLIDTETFTPTQITFDAFNSQEATLEAEGFRVFGPSADLAADVEPEYIAVSADSKTAFIALQENNGIAKLDIDTKTITDIFPLGTKDFNTVAFDVSNKDDIVGNFQNWNVLNFYQPDAIDYFEIGGTGYIITTNEGDARDYDGYSEEERVKDLTLDPTQYPNATTLQLDENLGRLKTTTANGDTDGDGDIDQIYGYGGRSFSIWSTDGELVYDSGNEFSKLTVETLGSYPEDRSDDKGTEPEAVTTFVSGERTFAVIGLERSGDVLLYDISNVNSPAFIQRLQNTSPEGLLIIDAKDSPNGQTLLVVSNEFPSNATLNIYSK